jgi:hypothetical protein
MAEPRSKGRCCAGEMCEHPTMELITGKKDGHCCSVCNGTVHLVDCCIMRSDPEKGTDECVCLKCIHAGKENSGNKQGEFGHRVSAFIGSLPKSSTLLTVHHLNYCRYVPQSHCTGASAEAVSLQAALQAQEEPDRTAASSISVCPSQKGHAMYKCHPWCLLQQNIFREERGW